MVTPVAGLVATRPGHLDPAVGDQLGGVVARPGQATADQLGVEPEAARRHRSGRVARRRSARRASRAARSESWARSKTPTCSSSGSVVEPVDVGEHLRPPPARRSRRSGSVDSAASSRSGSRGRSAAPARSCRQATPRARRSPGSGQARRRRPASPVRSRWSQAGRGDRPATRRRRRRLARRPSTTGRPSTRARPPPAAQPTGRRSPPRAPGRLSGPSRSCAEVGRALARAPRATQVGAAR